MEPLIDSLLQATDGTALPPPAGGWPIPINFLSLFIFCSHDIMEPHTIFLLQATDNTALPPLYSGWQIPVMLPNYTV